MIRRVLVIGLVVTAVCGVRLVASPPAAQAGVCDVPLVSAVCGVVSGVFDGVGWTVDQATGTVKLGRTIVAKIVATGEGYACNKISPLTVVAKLCTKILGKLSGGNGGPGGSAGGGATSTGGSAGGGTTPPTTVVEAPPVDTTPADAPQSYLRTSAIAAAAAAAMGTVAHEIGKETTANVASSWFQSLYGRAAEYAAAVALLALLLALADGAVHGDGELVAQALRAVPYAAIMTFAVTAIVALAVIVVDDAGTTIAGSGLSDARHVLDLLAALFVALGLAAKGAATTHHTTLAKVAAFPAAMFSIFGVVGAGLVALELLVRDMAIYAGTLFAPLIFAARIWPRLAHAGTRLGQTLSAVILSKLVLVMMLGLAGEAVLHGGLSGIAVGAAALFVAALAPGVVYGMIALAEHGLHARGLAADAGLTASASQRMAEVVAWNAARVDRVRGQAGAGNGPERATGSGAGEPLSAPTVDVPPPPRDPPSVPPVTATLADEEAGDE